MTKQELIDFQNAINEKIEPALTRAFIKIANLMYDHLSAKMTFDTRKIDMIEDATALCHEKLYKYHKGKAFHFFGTTILCLFQQYKKKTKKLIT